MPHNELYASYSKEALEDILTKSGFSPVKIYPTGGFFGAVGNLFYRRITYFNKKKWLFAPLMIIPWLCHLLDFNKNPMFSTNFVVVARKK